MGVGLALEACEFLALAAGSVYSAGTAVLLKTLLNGWCTSRNFGEALLPCFFCGLVDGDVGLHYAHCSAFLGVAAELCVGAIPRWHWYWLPPAGASTTEALQCAGLAVVAYHCFNHCRNGAQFSFCMANSFFKKMLLECKTLRCAFDIG